MTQEASERHPVIGTVWRHKKTGHVYAVIGTCRIEATNKPAYLYRRPEDGITWARPMDEFLDGRFERIDLSPTPDTEAR